VKKTARISAGDPLPNSQDLCGRSTTLASLRPCVFAFSSFKQPGSLREIHYLCVFAPLRLCVLFFQTAGSLREIHYRTAGSLREIHYRTAGSLREIHYRSQDLYGRSTTEMTFLGLYFSVKSLEKRSEEHCPGSLVASQYKRIA
jgi:hypothetical protein